MVKFELGNVFTQATSPGAGADLMRVVNLLTVEVTTWLHGIPTPGHVRLYQQHPGAGILVPTGLLHGLVTELEQMRVKVELVDQRQNPLPVTKAKLLRELVGKFSPEAFDKLQKRLGLDLGWLHDFQRQAVFEALTRGRGIVKAPTGSGKGEVVAALCQLPIRWLYLVHRANLAEQQAARIEKRLGEKVGVIGGGDWETARITCASYDTLWARIDQPAAQKLLKSAQGLILDEVHVSGASTRTQVVERTHGAYFRVGLSATPKGNSELRLKQIMGLTGRVIYEIGTGTLMDKQLLSRPTLKLVSFTHPPPLFAGTELDVKVWHEAVDRTITPNGARNELIARLAQRIPKPAMLFIDRIQHGHTLMKVLGAQGVTARFVYGDSSVAERQQHCADLVAGKFEVLICNKVFNEGVDLPSLAGVIITTAGASEIATLQQLGRGTRVERDASGQVIKDQVTVYDVADVHCGCMSTREWHKSCKWLFRHTLARIEAYTQEGFEVRTVDEHDQPVNLNLKRTPKVRPQQAV